MTTAVAPSPAPRAADRAEPLLRLSGVRKEYPGTLAVDLDPDVPLDFAAGTIHALVGENGAGKSTLVGVISGTTAPSAGTMTLAGRPYAPADVVEARRLGVDIVLQEPGLIDTMSVEENLLLGREGVYAPRVLFSPAHRRRLAERAMDLLGRRSIQLNRPAGSLTLEDQKFVELARALSLDPQVLVIDEMTANLSEQGVPELFSLLRSFADRGGLVIYISHYLEEVFRLCDQVTVMKDGRIVRTMPPADTSEDELSVLMVGRSIRATMFRDDAVARTDGPVVLEVDGLAVPGRFRDVSFQLHAGEVLGIAGLIGCGSEALALALFGDLRPSAGAIRVDGRPIGYGQPRDAIADGLAFVPSDREREGLILNLSLERNIGLPSVRWLQRYGLIGRRVETRIARGLIERLAIVARGPGDVPYSLSGGNRQKVVLAKWLVRRNRVLILHNPTRGVDVGGKAEIYQLVRSLADEGVAILLVSDELPELLGLSDTLLIMRKGTLSGRVSRAERPTEETVIGYML
ncbi:MAG TPA: sugar ABC transporter ATP-binding protein [Candidatus Limnocylindrales bacterium]|nr:sugar ABC transporter ATP-binding protein [Candidatus Limnocylindrales bacterium]